MRSLQTLFEDGSSHSDVDLRYCRCLEIFDCVFLLRIERARLELLNR